MIQARKEEFWKALIRDYEHDMRNPMELVVRAGSAGEAEKAGVLAARQFRLALDPYCCGVEFSHYAYSVGVGSEEVEGE